ncbi:MAG: helix-turn-helix domain-containing protein [Anaerolineaceae bacterium]|jgi:transcriptional regulator with XRE-family HTH domain|nr:helix-turn-helix domain-containing protein [Anaerolineaceae bacterium]
MDIKTIIANNIIELRKSKKWTQIELAEKLNYSDKAVSKWERAESLPDVTVLKQIADVFMVSVDYLLTEEHNQQTDQNLSEKKRKDRNHIIITLLSTMLVFLIATIIFVIFGLISEELPGWMVYIYALPIASIVLIVFNAIWGKPVLNYVFISLLLWSLLLAVYLSFIGKNYWLIFLIGIPGQAIILLWTRLKTAHH